MKAYMSTGAATPLTDAERRHSREPISHGASWQDWDETRSLNLLDAEAEYETRRILAETEPEAPAGEFDVWRNPDFVGFALADLALAEALAAVTADGGPLDIAAFLAAIMDAEPDMCAEHCWRANRKALAAIGGVS